MSAAVNGIGMGDRGGRRYIPSGSRGDILTSGKVGDFI